MNEAVVLISLMSDAAVSVFGSLLSASFCDALRTGRNRLIFWCGTALLLISQGAIYLLWDTGLQLEIYPLTMHLPLWLLLYILTGKRLWPAISILSAYLFCQMRRWLALLVVEVSSGGAFTQKLTELILTFPLLLILLRFAAPAIRRLMDYPVKDQCRFGLIPMLYYGFDYLTRIYMNLLPGGSPVVVEFMPTVCGAAYLIFLLYNSAEERRLSLLRQTQNNLEIQLTQTAREISALRESQAQMVQYRHDLRHHLQYLFSCIENGQTERAKGYISRICEEIEAQKVRYYCENEAVNLILSAFTLRAEKTGVKMDIKGTVSAFIPVSDNDLCVILSNALENALHACLPFAAAGTHCSISVEFRDNGTGGRFFLQVVNPCQTKVRFEKGLPVSDRPGHGIGVQSICAIVKRYGGHCNFSVENGKFIMRLFL